MANNKGTITRKDLITEDAMNLGPEYAKNMQIAIEKNMEFVRSILGMAQALKEIKGAGNNSELIKAKELERVSFVASINAIKQQEQAEISLLTIKKKSIEVSEAERKAKEAAKASEERLNKEKNKSVKLTAEEILDARILAKERNTLAIINSKYSSEYDKLTAKARLAARALQDIVIEGKKVGESTKDYNARLNQAQKEFDQLHNKIVAANRAVSRFNDNVGNYPQQVGLALKDLSEAFGVVVGIDMFATSVQDAFDIVRNFEAEIVNLAAIAGFSREEIAPLEAEIRKVASASINSATEVAALATELVKLGSTPEEVIKLLQPVNNLSIALQTTAEDAATLVKSLLNAYGETADQAVRYTDVLAESANRSALDFNGLRDSFSYLAPTARTLGISLEETAAMLGVLVDNGIKAESAGRLTSTAFIRLAKNGLTLEDALARINKAQKEGKSNLEILTVAGNLFGAEAAKIGIILANNTEKTKESTEGYKNAAGALQDLTDKQLKSINSELEILSSAWEEYILNTNEAAGGTRVITNVLRFLSSNLNTLANIAGIAGGAWLAWKAALFLAGVQSRLVAFYVTAQTRIQEFNTSATGQNAVAQTENAAATATNTVATESATVAEAENTAVVQSNTIAVVENAVAEEAETIAAVENTLVTEANTVAEVENTVATEANTIAEVQNTIATTANTVADAENVLIENADTIATVENTIVTEANTIAETINTAASEANTIAEVQNTAATSTNAVAQAQNTVAVEAVTVAQGANTVATNIASAAWLRFTAILKANTLGLIIAAIVAAIYYFNKFNESIEEQNRKLKAHQEAVKRDTTEFLKNRDINDKNIISIGKLSDRYEELIKKTNRNTAEQKELNAILDILSKTVPGSTTKMDQYGKALEINTAKTKEYIESKRKLYEIETKEKIKENIANLKEYEKTTRILNVTEEDANGLKLEGIGFITRRNDVLKVQNTVTRQWRDLTNDELKIYLKARIANEENLALTNKNIETLQRRLSVQKQLNDGAGGKVDPDAERTIEVIDGLIKDQEDKIKELSAKSGNRGQEIKAEIAKLKAERDLIYSDKNAGAVDKKETNDRIKRMKELRDALYQLTQFRYQNEIDANQKIIDSDKKTLDERLEAQFNNEQLRQSKSKETLEFELLNYQLDKRELQKLSKVKQDAFIEDAKIKVRALVDGKVATDKMTSDEKLILEKYYADKKILQEKDLLDRQAINDKEVELIQKSIDRQKILQDTKIQKALFIENEIYQQALQAAGKNAKLIEQAAEEHEQRMFAIKRRGAMLALKLQIDNLQNELLTNDKKVEADRISAQLREKLENDLVVAKTAFNELGNEKYIVGVEDKIESERAFRDLIIEMSQDLTNSLGDFANALFEKKISNIDDEIAKSDEYYKKLLEAAKGDDAQTKVIEKEQEKRREELEKKKRKEQVKQAIFDKALKIVNIGTATALGIMQAYAQLGPIAGSAAAILVGAIGAVNTAAVLATPIPKYKDGRKNGPKEKAIVGDGGRSEVVERKSGEVFITPATDTLIQLYAGDKVHKSVEDYQKQLQYSAMMANINSQGRMLTEFQAAQYFDKNGDETLKVMKETLQAIKNQKQNVIVNMPKIDITHEIWKSKNKNWS